MHLYTVINFEDQYNIDRKIKEKNKCKHFFQEHSNFVYTDKSCGRAMEQESDRRGEHPPVHGDDDDHDQ